MKTRIFLSSLALMLFVFIANTTYSQNNCCENKSASCCTESKECCKDMSSDMSNDMPMNDNSQNDKTGNAGGDSAATGTACVVSGETIGEGQGVKFDYYGKTYNFCCEGCLAKFKKEPMDHIKGGGLICPVMGDAIESKDVFVMHNGTKYYLCCESCVKKFEKDPEKYMNKGSK